MPFKPGESGNPAGRAKGSKDKMPAAVKEAILNAFDTMGGEKYLVMLARGDVKQQAIFCRLLEKVVPGELKVEAQGGTYRVFVVTGIEGSPGSTNAKLVAEIPKDA